MTNKPTSKVIQIIQGEYVTILCEDGSVWTQLATKCGWYCILEAHKEPEAKQEQKLPEVGDVYKDKLNGLTATVTSREYTYQNSQGFTGKQTESCFFDRFEELPDQDHIVDANKKVNKEVQEASKEFDPEEDDRKFIDELKDAIGLHEALISLDDKALAYSYDMEIINDGEITNIERQKLYLVGVKDGFSIIIKEKLKKINERTKELLARQNLVNTLEPRR